MRLAVSSFAWPSDRAAEMAAWLGERSVVHGVELVLPMSFADPYHASAAEVCAQKRSWNDHGLEVLSVQSLAFGKPDLQLFAPREVRLRFIDHLVRMAELAAALGSSRMVFGSPANRRRGDLAMDAAMAQAVDFFGELAHRIRHTGVCCCIEPNPPIYGDCDMVVHLSEAVELVRRVDDPSIRVQLDTGAMAYDRSLGMELDPSVLEEAIQRAGHMHVSVPGLLPVRTDDAEQKVLAGMGNGWPGVDVCSIEMRSPSGSDPRAALLDAIAAVGSWYSLRTRS